MTGNIMLWDGWTYVSNNSRYVLMLSHSMNKSEIIYIVNVSSEHHQSDFLLNLTKEIFSQCTVNMNVIKCVVTDSPTPMLKYRHLLYEEFSHIVPLPCDLHVANLLTKDTCKVEGLTNIVKGNCKIVNFFTKSHKWFHSSQEWAKKNKNNKYSFQSLCETLWYSMCKACMLIAYYQAFLEHAANVQGTLNKYPKIPDPVMQFLNVEHFMMNNYMLELVTPAADLIGYLEKAETNLANIAVHFLTLQVHFDNMEAKCYIHNKFIDIAVGIVSKQYDQYFLHPVCVIVMYLSPKYHNLAISKNFTHNCLKPEIVRLAMN